MKTLISIFFRWCTTSLKGIPQIASTPFTLDTQYSWYILRAFHSVEKEQQDNAQKLKDSAEAGNRVIELQRKLDHAREVVSSQVLPLWIFVKVLVCHAVKASIICSVNKCLQLFCEKLCNQQVRKLPGIELSKEEQLQQIDLLRKQLALKRDLLNKYRSFTSFDRETPS